MTQGFQPVDPSAIGHTERPSESTLGVFERVVTRLNFLLKPTETAVACLLDAPVVATDVEPCRGTLHELSRWLDDLGSPSEARTALKLLAGLNRRLGMAHGDPEWAVEAAEMIEELRNVVAVLPSTLTEDGARILFLGPATEDLDTLIWSALGAGFVVEHDAVGVDAEPDLILIATPADRHDQIALDPTLTADAARRRHPDALILVSKEVISLGEQLTLGRSCDALVVGPQRPATLLEEAHQLLDRGRSHLRLVQLASEQGPDADEIRAGGLLVNLVSDMSGVVTELQTGRANGVVLTSTYVGEHDDLISLIRSRPEMRRAAIIETTTLDRGPAWTSDPGSRPDAHVPVELGSVGVLEAVVEVIRRRSEIGAVPRSGSTTGLPWFSGRAGAERLLVLARRHDHPVTVGIVRFEADHPEDAIDELQADLSRQFRDEDVVARRTGHENLVVMSGIGRRTAMARLNGIVERFTGITARAAIAEYPFDGRDFDSLIEAVDDVLDRSEGIEADPVVGVDWSEHSRRAQADVLLIEPDTNLAAVLEATLARVDVTALTTATGDEAMTLLLDPTKPKPRLVVLEFDLPGLDGLSVLRRLERVGVLSRLNVVMLGTRTREADLAAAFDLGVIDVISKPVSPRMVARRFQRAMDR